MVTVGGKPIIYHIMSHYSNNGYNDFIVAAGYKQHIIRDFFKKIKINGIFKLLIQVKIL